MAKCSAWDLFYKSVERKTCVSFFTAGTKHCCIFPGYSINLIVIGNIIIIGMHEGAYNFNPTKFRTL